MACADVDLDIHGHEDYEDAVPAEPPVMRHYRATDLLPDNKGPLHELLQKQPAVLGIMQIASGIVSIGVGLTFAFTDELGYSFMTLFRLSHLTGALFIIAGTVSNLLFKYPALLPVSHMVNSGCIMVALIAAGFITADLATLRQDFQGRYRMEVMVLCVLVLEILLSTVLCFWFSKEKRSKIP